MAAVVFISPKPPSLALAYCTSHSGPSFPLWTLIPTLDPDPDPDPDPDCARRHLESAARAVKASRRRSVMLRALLGWAQRADWRRFQRVITRFAAGSLQSARLRRVMTYWLHLAVETQVTTDCQCTGCCAEADELHALSCCDEPKVYVPTAIVALRHIPTPSAAAS